MLAIKLSRKGKKNQPFFKIILLEKAKDPRGDFIEDLGYYNPLTKKISLKKERIKYWLSSGAQPTGSVHNLLVNHGIIKAKKVKVTKKKRKKEEETESEAPAAKMTKPAGGEPTGKKEEKLVEEKEKKPTEEKPADKKEETSG